MMMNGYGTCRAGYMTGGVVFQAPAETDLSDCQSLHLQVMECRAKFAR